MSIKTRTDARIFVAKYTAESLRRFARRFDAKIAREQCHLGDLTPAGVKRCIAEMDRLATKLSAQADRLEPSRALTAAVGNLSPEDQASRQALINAQEDLP